MHEQGDELITGVNGLLTRLRAFPKLTFTIPDTVFLNNNDLDPNTYR